MAVGITALMGTTAWAFFNLDASGNSYVEVAPASPWVVTVAAPTGGFLSPGSGTDTDTFTIINNTANTQTLNTVTWSLTTDANGGIFDTITNAFVDGCQVSWFSLGGGDGGILLPHSFATGTGITGGAVTVTMPANTTVNESACMGTNPQVTVSAT